MSKLNYMESILRGVEVDWMALEEVVKIQRGKRLIKSQLEKSGYYAVYQNSMTPLGYYHESNVESDTTFIISAGSAGEIGYSDVDFWAADDVYFLSKSDNVDSKFLYHFLLMEQFKILAQVRRASIPRLSRTVIEKLQTPVPPLEIQCEIVRILDKFTSLVKELTAELVARKQQYSYYRDELLTFEKDQVEWKTLDELVSFRRGSFPQPYGNSSWYDGENSMPFVQVADVSDFGFCLNKNTKQRISKLAQPKSVFVAEGTVIVSLQGTIGRVAITQYECYVDRTLAIFTDYKENINKKYFAYQLKNKFDVEKEYARGSTLKTITKAEFSKFKIPVPPLAEQERIVAILDKFDALTTSLTNGLPGEIALRQQQYEYYRELLLSFPKLEGEG